MEWPAALALMLGIVCGAMALGLPVAFAFLFANIVGAFAFLGGALSLSTFAAECLQAIGRFSLTPIPLFILMGEILFQSGVALNAIAAVDRLIARVPGRLSIVTIFGGTLFSTLSGSTIANTALLGNVLLPQMVERGYAPKFAMGPIMATGGIAMLIPPSALAVLLASLAEQPIAALLIAGIVPGILMAMLFVGYVVVRSTISPHLAPSYDPSEQISGSRWRPFLVQVVPLLSIFVVVVGSIFAGIASPTESAALGCVASTIACAAYRSLSWKKLIKAALETAKITTMILFIIAGSLTFSQVLAVSGATTGLIATMQGLDLGVLTIVIVMLLILLFLGAFMDQVSMLLLTLPFFIPLAMQQGVEMLWFMVLILLVMEISLLTPPFGLLLFVMKGVAPMRVTLTQVYAAAVPFVLLELAVLALIVLVPGVAIWLPKLIE